MKENVPLVIQIKVSKVQVACPNFPKTVPSQELLIQLTRSYVFQKLNHSEIK